jgi:galactitol-specific phosphotransferase system IIC component
MEIFFIGIIVGAVIGVFATYIFNKYVTIKSDV